MQGPIGPEVAQGARGLTRVARRVGSTVDDLDGEGDVMRVGFLVGVGEEEVNVEVEMGEAEEFQTSEACVEELVFLEILCDSDPITPHSNAMMRTTVVANSRIQNFFRCMPRINSRFCGPNDTSFCEKPGPPILGRGLF